MFYYRVGGKKKKKLQLIYDLQSFSLFLNINRFDSLVYFLCSFLYSDTIYMCASIIPLFSHLDHCNKNWCRE